ncbi:hypothetical protein A2U01_0101621, partial [Trifolium medium]|nr:hypothetical protein [Trifolium medium]
FKKESDAVVAKVKEDSARELETLERRLVEEKGSLEKEVRNLMKVRNSMIVSLAGAVKDVDLLQEDFDDLEEENNA